MIQQVGHQIIMEYGWVKINSTKHNLKTVMMGYEDGKPLRVKGKFIPRKKEFTGIVDSTQNSRGRGSQFINIGHGNQEQ
jgi:hypothetical protein